MIDTDVLEKVIDHAQKLGATYVEARAIEGKGRSLFAQQGALVSATEGQSSGIGIRVMKGGGMAFVSSDSLEKRSVLTLVERAAKSAVNSKRKTSLDLGKKSSSVDKWKVEVKEKFSNIDDDTFLSLVQQHTDAIKGIPKPALIANFLCQFSVTELKKYLYTSEGTRLEADISAVGGFAFCAAKATGGMEQRYHTIYGTGGWEWFKEKNLFELLKEDTIQVTEIAEKAESVNISEPITMVVGSEVAGIISHENVGHPSEGDRIMGREAAQAGESYWKHYLKTIGKEIVGSEHVSVSEDPTIVGSPGFYKYDDEGIPARKRRLIVKGRLNEPLLNREYGKRFGLESNGAARADGYAREPIIRMASTFIEPGSFTMDEMVTEINKGIYMKSFTEWNIDDVRFQSKYVGLECYLIENGEITTKRVKRPTLETTSLGLFKSIDACGKPETIELHHAGTCGKGDPMQLAPVMMSGPTLRIREVRLG
ncbi:MAG TPA: TldD/PmbA family protein [Candidatus Hodarchaeales archaeon]|nr:TldD/PmbA family protein [Candidatus Hodarchaeales archaeon]